MTVRVPENEKDKIRGGLVKVVVGNQNEEFQVHENLIRTSPFFNKAMSGPWQESAQRTIELPEDEPEIFAIYVHWLYYGTLPVFTDDASGGAEYLALVKAYTFGDKIVDTRFQNIAIDALVETSVTKFEGKLWYPSLESIQHAYNNTNELSLVRKLLVDMHVYAAYEDWLPNFKERGSIPKPFLFELASKLLGQQGRPRPNIQASDYHSHESETQ